MLLTPLNDSASSLDEARRWFEVATVICKFIPGGGDRATKVLCLFNYCDRDSDCIQDLGNVCTPPLPLWEQVNSDASSRSVTDVGPATSIRKLYS